MRTSVIRLVLLLALIAPTSVFAANFSDVPAENAHATAIQTLKDAGILTGYKDGTFKPLNEISRAETVALIIRALGITAEKTAKKMPFTDVPETAWFYPLIQKGVELKKLKGYDDKTFRPMNPITLPETLSLLLNFYQVGVSSVDVEGTIYDGLKPREWYSKYAEFAKRKHLIEPDANGHIDPEAKMTRQEVAELIYRMRAFQQTKKPFDITTGWTTTDHIDNFWKVKQPADWEIFKGLKNSVIWKRDSGQVFFTRMWPKSARISISVIDNSENLTAAQYFENVKAKYLKSYTERKPKFTETTLGGKTALNIQVPNENLIDVAVALPSNFLFISAEWGESPYGEFLKEQLEEIIASYEYIVRPPEIPKPVLPLADRLETLRQNILVADKWKELAPLFPDKRLISTDGIGIGTGPVDYYFSKEAGFTIKLERNSGTVLNIKETETIAF